MKQEINFLLGHLCKLGKGINFFSKINLFNSEFPITHIKFMQRCNNNINNYYRDTNWSHGAPPYVIPPLMANDYYYNNNNNIAPNVCIFTIN